MIQLKPSHQIRVPESTHEFDLLLAYSGIDFRLLERNPGDVFIHGNEHRRKLRPFSLKYAPEVKLLIEDHFRTFTKKRGDDKAVECWCLKDPTIMDYLALARFVIFGDNESAYANKSSNQEDRLNEMQDIVLDLDKAVGPLRFRSITTDWITLEIINKIEFADYRQFVKRTVNYAIKHFVIGELVDGRIEGWTRSEYETQHITIGAILY